MVSLIRQRPLPHTHVLTLVWKIFMLGTGGGPGDGEDPWSDMGGRYDHSDRFIGLHFLVRVMDHDRRYTIAGKGQYLKTLL